MAIEVLSLNNFLIEQEYLISRACRQKEEDACSYISFKEQYNSLAFNCKCKFVQDLQHIYPKAKLRSI